MARKLRKTWVQWTLAVCVLLGGMYAAWYATRKSAVDRLIHLLPFTANQPVHGAKRPFLSDLVADVDLYGAEKQAVRRLIKELENKNPSIRRVVLEALYELRSHAEPAIPAALKALDDPEGDVRRSAASFLRLMRLGTSVELRRFDIEGLSGRTTGFTFVPDGTVLVRAGEDGEVVFLRVSGDFPRSGSFEEIARIQAHEDSLFAMRLSHDGTKLVTVGTRSTDADSLDAPTSELTIHPLSDWIPGSPTVIPIDAGRLEVAAVSPDTQIFATLGRCVADGKPVRVLKLWDGAKQQELISFGRPSLYYHSLAFSPDGKRLGMLVKSPMPAGEATSKSVDLLLWDTTTGTTVARFTDLIMGSRCLALSPNGKLLALVGGEDDDSIVQLWEVSTQVLLDEYRWPNNRVFGISFSPDGNLLAAGSTGTPALAKLLLVVQGDGLAPFDTLVANNSLSHVTFASNGGVLAGGGWNGEITLWDLSAYE